jgi:hypothetical protein
MKFTLAKLKATGRRPRVHPNGFVQFDIEPNIMRLNVWPAEPIPGHPGRVHPIHNHSFDINSTIIHGELTNDVYAFRPSTDYVTHILHEAERVNEHDSVLKIVPAGAPWFPIPTGHLVLLSSRRYAPGQRYSLERNLFHDSVADGLTATLMTLEKPGRYQPKVAIPLTVNPMNDYRREGYDEDLLWGIIAQVL